MRRTFTVSNHFKGLQSFQVTFFGATRNFSVSLINSREVKEKETNNKNIKSSQNQGPPHPAAILAVLSIGVSAYIALVKSRGTN
jgi:hypothetical protein